MSYGPAGRRQRRRRSYAIWALLAIAIAVAFGITRAAGEAELSRAYLDLAFDVITTEADVAAEFSDMIANIEEFNRATLIELLQDLESETAAMADQLGDADPPEALAEANLFLRIATTTWRSALSDARNGLVALADDPLDQDGIDQLQRGLVDMRVGDSAYAGFLSELSGTDTNLQGGPPPAVTFVPTDLESLYRPEELARRMFLAPAIGPVQNVAIADLRLVPSAVGEEAGLPVLAFVGQQRADVTVSNRGNVSAVAITVRVSLLGNDGLLWEAEQEIDLLEGEDLTTLVFSDIPVEPGNTYEITATSLFEDDDDSDDEVSMLFMVNPEG